MIHESPRDGGHHGNGGDGHGDADSDVDEDVSDDEKDVRDIDGGEEMTGSSSHQLSASSDGLSYGAGSTYAVVAAAASSSDSSHGEGSSCRASVSDMSSSTS